MSISSRVVFRSRLSTTLPNKLAAAGLFLLSSLFIQAYLSPAFAATCISGQPACLSTFTNVFQNIISLLAPAAGVAFLVMFLFGGYKFITSGGDAKAAASARSTLTYAIIGLVLVVVSWLILLLVKSITQVDVTNVYIP